MTYASELLRELLERGPHEGEDFYRVKATGAGETKWFNVAPEQLEAIAGILDIPRVRKLPDDVVHDPDRRLAAMHALSAQAILYPGERLIQFADALLREASDYDSDRPTDELAHELAVGTGGGMSTEGVMRLLAESPVLASTEPEAGASGSPADIGRLVVFDLATRIIAAEIHRLREEE